MPLIVGTPGDDVLPGTPDADLIQGLAGDDVLIGGGSDDVLDGGADDDTFFVDEGDQVIEANGGGFDQALSSTNYLLTAGAYVELLSTTDNEGTEDLNLTGNELGQTVIGNSGNNQLNGGGGVDTLIGLGGDDIMITDGDDIIVEDTDGGNDQVLASASYVLTPGAHIELLTPATEGTEAINLTGNELSQTVAGNNGNNRLNGGGGVDVLVGLGGNDILVTDGDDIIVEDATGGRDQVLASANYVLTAGAYAELLSTTSNVGTANINLTGNALGQGVIGNEGNNRLDGGGGADVLVGLGGNDILVTDGDDIIVEDANGGRDQVLASANYVLNADAYVELLSTTSNVGTANINLTGNALGQGVIGNNGNNRLDGGGGGDVLVGLGGNDILITDGDDIIVEDANGGRDQVLASANYVLTAGAYAELLSTTSNVGTANINLTGNELGQGVIGNNGNNILDGGGGDDVLVGLGGNDLLYVDFTDSVVEDVGGGYDYVLARTSFVLSAGAEVELLSTTSNVGTANVNLTGNELGQGIVGNAAGNLLDGKEGLDVLVGLGGADAFMFSTALGASNVDRVDDMTAGLDRIYLGGESGQPFAALASGALAAGSFVIGTAAAQSDDYIIYNSATGALLYDADGNGAGAAVQFATLSTGLNLTAADFAVIGPANNLPVITSGASASVAENGPAGSVVYQTAAADADGDRITYSLSGADAGFFSIDSNGTVRLLSPADYETRPSYSIVVNARDSSGSGASRAVGINVTDVAESTLVISETTAPNESRAAAQSIDRGVLAPSNNPNLTNDDLPSVTIQGAVTPATDVDFYSISLQTGEKLILDIDAVTGGLDTVIRIYDSNGVEVGYVDDSPLDPGSDPHPNVTGSTLDSFASWRAPSSGTYYFSVESYGPGIEEGPGTGDTSGTYNLHVSIAPPATFAEVLDEDIEALVSGTRWPGNAVTYSFPTLASHYPAGTTEATAENDFQPFSTLQQQVVTQQLQLISQVANLNFSQQPPGPANLRYALSSEPDVAYAYYPGSDLGGTAWFNNEDGRFANPVPGNYAWMGILHETGHALGLKHGHELPAISFERDSLEYSVMTYRSFVGASVGADGGYSNETWGYPQSLMMLDIAALQRIYGANFNHNSGDSTYSWNSATGQMSISGAAQAAPGANRVFMTIWDGGGNDTYNLSNYTNTVTIDLRPGQWTTTSQVQLANLGQGNTARGNVANSLLFNGDARSLIENAVGGSGNDTLIANQVSNQLTGNGGADTFAWRSAGDAGPGGLADTITDFLRGTDRIDLSAVDAISSTGGNEGFNFLGTNAFTGSAGQLRYQVEGSNVRVQADLDGNGVADMEIIVNNTTILSSADFLL